MNLTERVNYLRKMFFDLESTTSRLEKQSIIAKMPAELNDDFQFCLEILDGRKKLGYTAYKIRYTPEPDSSSFDMVDTLRKYLSPLWKPLEEGDLSDNRIHAALSLCPYYTLFYVPLVNRLYRLGIGKSILPAAGMAPMLGKKYEGYINNSLIKDGIFLTEKLDGNRCIAYYDGTKWNFQSRNAKPMKVDFDMIDLPTDRVYDGEILSPEQVKLSINIAKYVTNDVKKVVEDFDISFNRTSGLINSHASNKNLIYNIFDVLDDNATYFERRNWLTKLGLERSGLATNVRILPTLMYFDNATEFKNTVPEILGKVTEMQGEGVMINLANAKYEHKRSDVLLKYKLVSTMDMKVIDVFPGTGESGPGKNGAIEVAINTDDGKFITCKVGSGLSKKQCEEWSLHPDKIIGKTVEIAYHELSQNRDTDGSDVYSLRFPRLKQIRIKNETSEY